MARHYLLLSFIDNRLFSVQIALLGFSYMYTTTLLHEIHQNNFANKMDTYEIYFDGLGFFYIYKSLDNVGYN